jgi:hypothetical protein
MAQRLKTAKEMGNKTDRILRLYYPAVDAVMNLMN